MFYCCLHNYNIADFDYRGSVLAVLESRSQEPIELRRGTSILQIIPVQYFTGAVTGAEDWGFPSERNCGNFGSTEARRALAELLASTHGGCDMENDTLEKSSESEEETVFNLCAGIDTTD